MGAFRTTSRKALSVVLGIFPIDINKYRAAIYWLKKGRLDLVNLVTGLALENKTAETLENSRLRILADFHMPTKHSLIECYFGFMLSRREAPAFQECDGRGMPMLLYA